MGTATEFKLVYVSKGEQMGVLTTERLCYQWGFLSSLESNTVYLDKARCSPHSPMSAVRGIWSPLYCTPVHWPINC